MIVIKRFGVAMLLFIVEFASYRILLVEDHLTFFGAWFVILFLGAMASIFDLYGGGVQQGYHIGNISITPEMNQPPKQKKSYNSRLTPGNLTMLIYALLNLIFAIIAYNITY